MSARCQPHRWSLPGVLRFLGGPAPYHVPFSNTRPLSRAPQHSIGTSTRAGAAASDHRVTRRQARGVPRAREGAPASCRGGRQTCPGSPGDAFMPRGAASPRRESGRCPAAPATRPGACRWGPAVCARARPAIASLVPPAPPARCVAFLQCYQVDAELRRARPCHAIPSDTPALHLSRVPIPAFGVSACVARAGVALCGTRCSVTEERVEPAFGAGQSCPTWGGWGCTNVCTRTSTNQLGTSGGRSPP